MDGTNIGLRTANLNDEAELVTTEELAKLTGLSASTIRRRKEDGTFPYWQPAEKNTALRFRAKIILELLKNEKAGLISGSIEPQPKTLRHGRIPRWMND